jgi:hypothetical protein
MVAQNDTTLICIQTLIKFIRQCEEGALPDEAIPQVVWEIVSPPANGGSQ